MVCETRSGRRLLRSVATIKRIQFKSLGSQGKAKTQRSRVVAQRIPEQNEAVCEDVKDLNIPPEYEWVRVIYMRYGPEAMGLLLEMTQPDLDQVLWVP